MSAPSPEDRRLLKQAKLELKEAKKLLRRGGKRLSDNTRGRIRRAIDDLGAAIGSKDPDGTRRASEDLAALLDQHLAFARKSSFRETVESMAVALAVAMLLRFFVIEAFKIPSGSMVPTLLVGDHIFVSKFIYGLRIPLTHKWFFRWHTPKRGEVVVFMYPEDPDKDFIKRVIGVPGDTIEIRDGELHVTDASGREVPISWKTIDDDYEYRETGEGGTGEVIPCVEMEEDLDGVVHRVLYRKDGLSMKTFGPVTVRPGHFFAMGDNRDNSSDSRYWGQVPFELLKGKALFIWYSGVHLARIGTLIE